MKRGKENKTILLIDDDPAIYHTIKIVIGNPEYSLVYFDNTEDAARYIRGRGKANLIILDIMLPNQSGLEFLDELKRMKAGIPVIVISAINTAKAAAEAMKKGASDYVTKPFALEEIRGAIGRSIE